MSKNKKLKEAAKKTKLFVDELKNKSGGSTHWNYELMERSLKETYLAIKDAWKSGEEIETISDYLSDKGLRLLNSSTRFGNTDLVYMDILDCFDSDLEDLAIIAAYNLPGDSEDFFVAWLDNEHNSSKDYDIESDSAAEVEDFGMFDNLSNLSGFKGQKYNIFGLQIDLSFIKLSPNDCWTFKWDTTKNKWVLDNIAFDDMTDSYLRVLSKPMDTEGEGFNYPRLV